MLKLTPILIATMVATSGLANIQPRTHSSVSLAACEGVIFEGKCVVAKSESNGGFSGTGSAEFRSNVEVARRIASDPGSQKEPSEIGSSNRRGPSTPDPCSYVLDADLSLYPTVAAGRTAKDGFIVTPYCPQALSLADQKLTNIQAENAIFIDYNNPVPPPPPPPNPVDLAEQATALLPIPTPTLNLGPHPEDAVVNRPLWLWVDNPGNLTSTVALLGVQVTATATLTTTTWSMGESVDRPGDGNYVEAVEVCDGPGSPPPSQDELNRTPAHEWEPACGHTYRWRSNPDRTQGTGKWPVTATTKWTVNWTSNVGVTGTTVLETTNTTSIEVLELKVRLVDNPDAPIPGG